MPLRTRPSCAFKMPKNPKYRCPRIAIVEDRDTQLSYCRVHDRCRERRCDVRCGIMRTQCTGISVAYQEQTSKEFCQLHRDMYYNSSLAMLGGFYCQEEVACDNAGGQMLARAYSPSSSNGNGVLLGGDHLNHKIEKTPSLDAASMQAPQSTKLPTSPLPLSPRSDDTGFQKENIDQLPSPTPSTPALFRSPTTPSLQPEPNVEESKKEKRSPMNFVCNICLQKHSSSLMDKVEECGHEFSILCVHKLRKTGSGRQYNCSSCQKWSDAIQANGAGQ